MQKRFADTMMELRGLINDWSAPVLLAVSGGVDSMCMAELFASQECPVPFAIAHCNFHLRGEESDGDEQFVCQWAASIRWNAIRSRLIPVYRRKKGE